MMRSVARLRIHPIKGARGLDVHGMDFDQLGPRFDRRWMVVGSDGTFVSQRVAPRLATVRPSIDGDTTPEAVTVRIAATLDASVS